MTTLSTADPRFVCLESTTVNTGVALQIAISLANIGLADAAHVSVTDLLFGQQFRMSPRVLPIYLGGITRGSKADIIVRFDSSGLMPGQGQQLIMQLTYISKGTLGATVTLPVVIPEPTPELTPKLKARIDVALQPSFWNYTISNDEPVGSPLRVAAVSIAIAAPVSVTGTPPGWVAITDNATYVGWVASDTGPPFVNHVSPGSSLGGFQINSPRGQSESTPFLMSSWNSASNAAGVVAADFVSTPARVVP